MNPRGPEGGSGHLGFIPGGPWARLRRIGWLSDLLVFVAGEGFDNEGAIRLKMPDPKGRTPGFHFGYLGGGGRKAQKGFRLMGSRNQFQEG